MAVATMPARSMTLSTRLHTAAPHLFAILVGGMLELMIHAVETWRDHRPGPARG